MSRKRDASHIRAQRQIVAEQKGVCTICRKSSTKPQGHHLIFHANGGPATTQNMGTLCTKHHRDYHAGKLKVDIIRF
jgi:hypothetical protein